MLNSRGNVVLSAEKTAGTTTTSDVTEQQINSELEILYSNDVVGPVADPQWETLAPAQRTPNAVHRHEKLVQDFQRRLSADPVRKSNVISVTLVGDSAKEAQNTLQSLATAYLGEHRQLQRPTGASDFFTTEAESARVEWESAVQDLVNFQQKHELVSIVDQQTSLEKDITGVESDLRAAQSSLSELNGRLEEDTARLEDMPHRQTTTRKTVPNQQAIQQLSTLLVELENKRTALLTGYLPSDRLVKEVDRQIEVSRTALTAATSTNSEEVTSDIDPTYQAVRLYYAQDKIKDRAALQQRNTLLDQLARLQRNLSNVQSLTGPFNLLQSRAENLKENYQLYVQKRDQAQIEDAMDERKLLNVAVAEQPTLSFAPVKPKPLTNFALGLVSALFLGLCAVYFAEMARNTFATAHELEDLSPVPVLATLPFVTREELEAEVVELRKNPVGPQGSFERTNGNRTKTPFTLACDALVDQIFFSNRSDEKSGLIIALTSPQQGTGVTLIANLIADRLGSEGADDVVFIDARSLTQPAPAAPGVGDTESSVRQTRINWRSNLLAQLGKKYQYIIIDCPSLKEPRHIIGLAPLVDGILLVEEANRTQKRQMLYAETTLQGARGHLLGHILNKRTYAIPYWFYRRLEALGI